MTELEAYKQEQRDAGTHKRYDTEACREIKKAMAWLDKASHSYQAALFIDKSPERLAEWRTVSKAFRTLQPIVDGSLHGKE